jgi:hypothetical protein
MSSDHPEKMSFQRNVAIVVGAGLVFVFVGLLLYATVASTPSTGEPASGVSEDNGLERARQTLVRAPGQAACRSAIQYIRTYLASDPDAAEKVPVQDDAEKRQLTDQMKLTREEEEEIQSRGYSLLDAAHLAHCLLLHDAARSLVGKEDVAAHASLEQARAAFAWVIRQVRLQDSRAEPVPPEYVLGRGWGTAVERALVFLALLEQVGSSTGEEADLTGCLLVLDSPGGNQRLWACGVLPHGSRDVYLFDPWLGMPIPGPRGKGIATLEQASSQDVLAQLSKGSKVQYETTRQQAREAKVLLVSPLSALSARMRYLQETFLGPNIKVRLAAGPTQQQKAFAEATKRPVSFWQPGTSLLRRFLMPEEGGIDQARPVALASVPGFTSADDTLVLSMGRKQIYVLSLVPWMRMPEQVRDPRRFPYNVDMGRRVRNIFGTPFWRSSVEEDGARHLLLRGRFDQAVQSLIQEKSYWQRIRKQSAGNPNVARQADAWIEEAIAAYANLQRSPEGPQRVQAEQKIEELWNNAEALHVLLGEAMADARQGEVLYLLALCKQEQAEHLQARLEAAPNPPAAQQKEQVRQVWEDSLNWWNNFLENNSKHSAVWTARRRRAEVHLQLGSRQAALADLTEVARSAPSDRERLAAHSQVEQLQGQK